MKYHASAAASHLDTIRCGFYFTGQNLFYLLIYMYLNTYFTDIGIPVLAVAVIGLSVRLLDAFSGPVFMGLLSRLHHKNRLLGWMRLAVLVLPLAAVALFSIPSDLSPMAKLLWSGAAYLVWDLAHTACNAPLFGLEGSVTRVLHGRTVLSAVGRLGAMAAMVVLLVVIPTFRDRLGGWGGAVALLAVIGLLSMLPGCIFRSRRTGETGEAGRIVSIGQIFGYLRGNRYLSIYYLAFLLIGVLNVSSCWGLYIARICLHQEALFTVTGIASLIPAAILGGFLPALTRRADKFRLLCISVVVSVTLQFVRYLVGYDSVPLYVILTVLASVPTGFTTALLFRFTRDCAEYGRYMGQVTDPALPFATQMFMTKLQGAGVMALSCIILAFLGFVEGEGAVQSVEFADRLWNAAILVPCAGMLAGLLVLRQYDLRDHDVVLMQMCNEGRISPEEARRQLHHIKPA